MTKWEVGDGGKEKKLECESVFETDRDRERMRDVISAWVRLNNYFKLQSYVLWKAGKHG